MPHPDVDLPELYDLDCADFSDDLPFYENLARACDGPVLELGAGTGRVAIPLARAGFDVCGIDSSDAMLARARCKATGVEQLQLVQADMRDFDVGRRFDLVFAGFGAFHHLLTPDDQLACLRCVRRHLAPGGLFVCDLRPLLHADWHAAGSAPLFHDWTKELPRTGETVTKLVSVRPDRARQVQHEQHIYDRIAAGGTLRRLATTVDLRYTTRFEMEGLLREAGLALEHAYGDYELSPYNDQSELLITIARLPVRQAGKPAKGPS